MLAKIKLLDFEEVSEYGQIKHKVKTNKAEEVFFNTSLIKFINILKLDKKTVWKVQLTDSEILFTLPFKL